MVTRCRALRTEGGMLNAVGLQNPVSTVSFGRIAQVETGLSEPVVANISGFSLDEYTECCARIDKRTAGRTD